MKKILFPTAIILLIASCDKKKGYDVCYKCHYVYYSTQTYNYDSTLCGKQSDGLAAYMQSIQDNAPDSVIAEISCTIE